MPRALCILIFWFVAATQCVLADQGGDTDEGVTKILVTFADAGMSNAARPGAARPGYSRRGSTYLVSVGVKRAANRIARDFDLITLDEWPIVSLKVHCLVFGVRSDIDIEQLFSQLRQRPEVESAQPLNEFEVSATSAKTTSDTYAGLQHNLVTLEIERAHRWSRGDGIEVSIIDTGADFNHPELRSRIVEHRDFVGSGDGAFNADIHGTAVAGVIGAELNNGVGMVGVAPLTQLSVLKACWQRTSNATAVCDTFTLAKALNYAIEAKTDIINLSLNGPSDALLGRMVELALDRGIVVVAAAPEPVESGFPVEIPGVIIVGSNDRDEANQAYGRPIFKAPGADILVPVPAGGYDFASGTSLSAAQVSGVVALLVAINPDLTADEIMSLLASSPRADAGSVNACRALALLLAEIGCETGSSVAAVPVSQNGTERLSTN